MKKLFALLLTLALALAVPAALAEVNGLLGKAMPDFTVTTVDGEDVTLSKLLTEKELVIVNIFTSWCPPCRYEFPELESVYERYKDRMEIVAVSHEPGDTQEVLRQYRDEMGLTFPVGHISGTGIDQFVPIQGYPTSLLINRDGVVGFFQLGAFNFDLQIEAVVNHFLDENYDGGTAGFYGAYVIDQEGEAVPGVYVNYCTDTACLPCVSDENGLILFVGAPEAYHLQILKAPEGYSFDAAFEATTDPAGGAWTAIQVTRDED